MAESVFSGSVFRDQTAELVGLGYGALKAECVRLGLPIVTGMNWVRSGRVRGGVAGRMFGSNGVVLVHIADLEHQVRRKGEAAARRRVDAAGAGGAGDEQARVDDPVSAGMKLLAEVAPQCHVTRATIENWIVKGKIRGGKFVRDGRSRWFVSEADLAWKVAEKDRKLAEDWRKAVLEYGPIVADWVWDLFERVAEAYRKAGVDFEPFPERPPQEWLEQERRKIQEQVSG